MCASVISPPLHLSPTTPFHLVTSPSHLTISTRLTQPQPHHTLPPQEALVAHNPESTQCGVNRSTQRWLTYLSGSRSTSWYVCVLSLAIDTTTAGSKRERDKWAIASWWRAFCFASSNLLLSYIVAHLISFSHGHAFKLNLGSVHMTANNPYILHKCPMMAFKVCHRSHPKLLRLLLLPPVLSIDHL